MKLDPKVTQIGPKCDPNRTQTSIGSVLGSCWAAFGSTFIATSKRAAARPWLLPSEAERHQTSGKGFRSASFYGDRGAPWSALVVGLTSTTKFNVSPLSVIFANIISGVLSYRPMLSAYCHRDKLGECETSEFNQYHSDSPSRGVQRIG